MSEQDQKDRTPAQKAFLDSGIVKDRLRRVLREAGDLQNHIMSSRYFADLGNTYASGLTEVLDSLQDILVCADDERIATLIEALSNTLDKLKTIEVETPSHACEVCGEPSTWTREFEGEEHYFCWEHVVEREDFKRQMGEI